MEIIHAKRGCVTLNCGVCHGQYFGGCHSLRHLWRRETCQYYTDSCRDHMVMFGFQLNTGIRYPPDIHRYTKFDRVLYLNHRNRYWYSGFWKMSFAPILPIAQCNALISLFCSQCGESFLGNDSDYEYYRDDHHLLLFTNECTAHLGLENLQLFFQRSIFPKIYYLYEVFNVLFISLAALS